MATRLLDNTTAEEKLIWAGLVFTYPCYMVGGLYILGSVIGWILLMIVGLRWFVEGKGQHWCFPIILWVWIASMLMMLVALLVAHFDRELGLGKTIKSSIGWAKGWALFAVFPILGAIIPFKQSLLVRGCCMIAAHSLIFSVVSLLAFVVGLQGEIFVSPLKAVGGPGDEYFTFQLYALNPETGLPRWSFFAPWAPASGLLACMYLIICSQEKNNFWFFSGVIGAMVMCLLSQSRAGWVFFAAIFALLFFSGQLRRPSLLMVIGLVMSAVVLLGQPVFEWLMDSYQQIKDSRPGSTRVRAALAEIALQRWQNEAPIWGHGIVEIGPKMVEHMPIGSHHSWYGLLFVKGLVGAIALATPMIITVTYLLFIALRSSSARIALVLMGLLLGYSFFENLEILVYLFWPALLWLGAALNPLRQEGI